MKARARVLTGIDVRAHGNVCASDDSRKRTRAYRFAYTPDVDTGLPRLHSAFRLGHEDGDDSLRIPLGTYSYGAMTSSGAVEFRAFETLETSVISSLNLAADGISWSMHQRTQGGLVDFTGDGRADVIRTPDEQDTQIIPMLNASTGATHGPRARLSQSATSLGVGAKGLATQSHGDGFDENHPTERLDTLRRVIDFNADGRPDLLSASEDDHWTLQINMPARLFDSAAGPNEIQWDTRKIPTDGFRQQLIAAKLLPDGFSGPVPLSRTARMSTTQVSGCGSRIHHIGSVSITEWSLEDMNGDGYPDIVMNELPVGAAVTSEVGPCGDNPNLQAHQLQFVANPSTGAPTTATNRYWVYLNKAGNYTFDDVWPYASPLPLAGSQDCGIRRWETVWGVNPPADALNSHQTCGLIEVNGDGVPDFLQSEHNGDAFVSFGSGSGFAGRVALPARPSTRSDGWRCDIPAPDPETYVGEWEPPEEFDSGPSTMYIDVTSDGIPDVLWPRTGEVQIGAGVSWGPRVEMPGATGAFVSTASCDPTAWLRMRAGLYDVDGDGRLDYVKADADGWKVSRIVNFESGRGAYDAGRLTLYENGYGASMQIRYASAKNDAYGSHHVPFAEIVVAETTTHTGTEAEQPIRYAYDRSKMRFDAVADRWVPTGFGRHVSLRGRPNQGRLRGVATISDTQLASNRAVNYQEYALHGRATVRVALDGDLPDDPWQLLRFESDPDLERLIHNSKSLAWDTRMRTSGAIDCLEYPGYFRAGDLPSPPLALNGRYDRPCTSIGFAYVTQTDSWEGDGSFTGNAVFTRTQVVSIDAYGRPLETIHYNDLKDDTNSVGTLAEAMKTLADRDTVCVDTTYDSPAAWMYHAVETVTVRSCDEPNHGDNTRALARLTKGWDQWGRMTKLTSDRFETTQGLFQDRVEETITYDSFSNPFAQLEHGDGVERRTTRTNFDPFYLVADTETYSTNDARVPSLTSTTIRDPYTLARQATTNADGTTVTAGYDVFGRQVARGLITPDDPAEHLLSEHRYVGFEAGTTNSRYIERVDYTASNVAPRISRSFIDALGRNYRVERVLGEDYDESIISDETTFDDLGRTSFVAAPYPAGEAGARFGTSYHYRSDGSLYCQVRASGQAPLITTTDASAGIYPTCFERQYSGENVVMRVYGPEELTSGLGANTPHWEEVLSAKGRVLQRSRIGSSGERLELVRFGYDKLGNSVAVSRYGEPSTESGALTWSFARDTDGNALVTSEPHSASVFNDFDALGRLVSTTWDDNAGAHEIRYAYDASDRPYERVELLNATERPETRIRWDYDQASADPRFANRTGRLSSATSFDATGQPTMQVEYGYDALGRIEAISRRGPDGESYDEDYGYRLNGELDYVTFRLPDNEYRNETASYDYDSAGRLRSVNWNDSDVAEEVYRVTDIDAFGRPLQISYGNGAFESYSYRADRNRELTGTYFRASDGTERATNIVDYTADFRVAERIETNVSASGTLSMASHRFWYDERRNLKAADVENLASTGPLVRSQNFSYDALGNTRNVTDIAGSESLDITYDASDPDKVCRTEPWQPVAPPAEPPAPNDEDPNFLWFEAESGRLHGAMAARIDTSRSGGGYVELPQGTSPGGSAVSYRVNVPESGQYSLWAKVRGPDTQSNSFRVAFGGTQTDWHPTPTEDFAWRVVGWQQTPRRVWLSAGTHSIYIEGRDPGAQIDRLALTRFSPLNPSATETAMVPSLGTGEAEDAAAGSFVVDIDSTASGGELLTIPAGFEEPAAVPGETVSVSVQVPAPGRYALWLRVRAEDERDDSMSVSFAGHTTTWHPGASGDWSLHRVTDIPPVWLWGGTQNVELGHVESGIEVDLVVLTDHLTATPIPTVAPATEGCQYHYDERGNVTSIAANSDPSRHFQYDGLQRVKTASSGSNVARYTYGPEGDAISLSVTTDDIRSFREEAHYGALVTKSWFNDGTQSLELVERRIPGVPMQRRGAGPDARVTYSHADSVGVRRMTNHAGQISQELNYQPYGDIATDSGRPDGIAGTQHGFNFGNHLRELGIVRIGARIYEPRIGRFLQRDPLIVSRTASMMNPYAFAWNDPVNVTDYSGMDGVPGCIGAECIPQWVIPSHDPNDVSNFHWPWFQAVTWDNDDLDLEIYLRQQQLALLEQQQRRLQLEMMVTIAVESVMTFEGGLLYDEIVARGTDIENALAAARRGDIVGMREALNNFEAHMTLNVFGGVMLKGVGRAVVGGVRFTRGMRAGALVGRAGLRAKSAIGGALRSIGQKTATARGKLKDLFLRRRPPGPVCFAAGTLVETLDGLRAIEEVEVGDVVWSRDPDTGDEQWKPVVQTFVRPERPLFELQLGGNESVKQSLRVTAEHPFRTTNGWVAVHDLMVGDRVWSHEGWLDVTLVRSTADRETVYNLEVLDFHTYFVGTSGIWVHNTCIDDARQISESLSSANCWGRCFEHADDLAGALRNRGIGGEILEATPSGHDYWVTSVKYGKKSGSSVDKALGERGMPHRGVRVGDTVFDNLTPEGMPYARWLDDIGVGLPNGPTVTVTPF